MVKFYTHSLLRFLVLLSAPMVEYSSLSGQNLHATIRTSDTTRTNLTPISPEMHGGFIEYIDDVINGQNSLSAQELLNRGFDMPDNQGDGLSKHWKQWPESWNDSGKCTLLDGGYNVNGKYYQRIANNTEQNFGIAQQIQLPSIIGTECYVYCRSDNFKGNIYIALVSLDGKEIYTSAVLGTCTNSWQKLTMRFSPIKNVFQCQFVIYIDTVGVLEVDEASVMAQDNFHGIRREQFNLYNAWKPSVIRFMGGCFSDQPVGFWEYSIGDIDQRPSPNIDWIGAYQRIDFGTDEYMDFCKEIGAEPQLTVGFGNGTPQDAANWVEYCNGDSTTKYGALRARNGHALPYNVKFWEVGNEQYGPWEIGHTTAVNYANRYIDFCRAMKKVDSTIQIMINGDMWGKEWNDTIIKIAAEHIDLFSVHYVMGNVLAQNYSKDSTYRRQMFNPYFVDYWFNYLEKTLHESGLRKNTKIALTEWLQLLYQTNETQRREQLYSLQAGIWNAMMFNVLLHHASTISLVNKTVYFGVLQSGNSSTGERVIYGDPSYHVLRMFNDYSRKNSLKIDVESSTYNYDFWTNVPWLNAHASYSEDTIVYTLVNSHPTDSMEVDILFAFPYEQRNALISQIYSNDVTDANTPDNPVKIIPQSRTQPFNGKIHLPPHSFTLIELGFGNPDFIDTTRTLVSDYMISIQPNVVEEMSSISIEVPETGTIRFEIVNTIGEKVFELPGQEFSAGKYTVFSFNANEYASGMYYCNAYTPNGVKTAKFSVIR